jgi:hypothetical protein
VALYLIFNSVFMVVMLFKVNEAGQMRVAHTCNPSYSGGRDQEDQGSKPAWANSLQDPILKNPTQKRAGGVTQVVERLPSKHEALNLNPSTANKVNVAVN